MTKPEDHSDALTRALELELQQKRAAWQRDKDKYRTIRVLSFSFLSLIILAALLAVLFALSRSGEPRSPRPGATPMAAPP